MQHYEPGTLINLIFPPAMHHRLLFHNFKNASFSSERIKKRSQPFAAPTNEYLLKWTPRKQSTCQDDANAVAQKFSASGVKVLTTSCVKDHGNVSEISVFLDQSTPPELYSALFAYRLGPESQSLYRPTPVNRRYDLIKAKPYFRTLDEGLANIPTYEQSFVSATGLEPLASQCMSVSE